MQLSQRAKRVLVVLLRRWRLPGGGNSWKSFAVDMDRRPHGSGYFLTAKGDR